VTPPTDRFELERFVAAQNADGTFERALGELRAGRKTSHWIWFIFPQLAGLGHSTTSRAYAIGSLAEAEAYARDPLLGARLAECARALLEHGGSGNGAEQILGAIDAVKLRSSMTLFARAAPEQRLFGEVLEKYFGGVADPATDALLD
jgi:uncharacterized protein (DUF1810 family)